MAFLDQYGYTPYLSFPADSAIADLQQKAREKKLEDKDYQTLLNLMQQRYSADDYLKAAQEISTSFTVVSQTWPVFEKFNRAWDFKLFPVYTVQLTLYGTGGSYDPDTGNIIMRMTEEGSFVEGTNPADIIIHESVHLGIEPLIQQYAIDQRVKERIVDRFVQDNFHWLVPDYTMQPTSFTDASIDPYLQGAAAWDQLPEKLKEYTARK
jgi:hypothetical protein